jgi:hypothetical protein
MKCYDILSCFAVFPMALIPMALFAAEERAFVPSPLTTAEVLPGRQWDGKGAEQLQGPFADALKMLLDAGFPDPAGLVYQKITIPTGNCNSGDSGEIETEGWLLPAENDSPLYAIAWNGLVYFKVISTGANLTRGGDKARAEMVGKIRADWLAHGKATGAERAYRVLTDDGAGAALWADAADSLFERGQKPDPPNPRPGEVLRDDRVPSVTDLLEKRVAGVMKNDRKATADDERMRCRLLSCLLAWEPDRGRRVIARQVDAWLADDNWGPLRSEAIVNFVKRSADDAPVVLRVVEAMAWKMKPDDYPDFHTGETVTDMLVHHGDSPYLKRSQAGLFTDPQSPWCLAKLNATKLKGLTGMWLGKKLVTREPFRSALLRALADGSVCAVAMLDPKNPGQWICSYDNANYASRIPDDKDFTLKPGMKIQVRRKDVVARALTDPDQVKKGKAAPALEYWWPKEKRDARIAEMLNLLSGPT